MYENINSKEQLIAFILEIRETLDMLVNNITLLIPKRKDMHGLLKNAWGEVYVAFDNSIKQLNRIPNEKIEKEGLSGYQLQLKLSEYSWRKERLNRIWNNSYNSSLRIGRPKLNIVRKAISRLLKAIDNILDSLSNVVPPLHAIKEIKDTLDSIISG